jgi:hypothetical protein
MLPKRHDKGLFTLMLVNQLSFAGAGIVRHHLFDGGGGFYAALLLQFINPISYGFNHFARGLRGRGSLRRGPLLAHPVALLDDFYSFLF